MFSAAVAGDSDVESNNSDGDGDEEDEEVLGEGLDAASDEEELELGPEHGEDAAEYDLDEDYVGYEDPYITRNTYLFHTCTSPVLDMFRMAFTAITCLHELPYVI